MFHHPLLFIAAYQAGDIFFYPTYKKVVKTQWKRCAELIEDQEKQLRYLINFVCLNVPHYHKLFDILELSPDDIKKYRCLVKLPILNKYIMKQKWDDFKPVNLGTMKYSEIATACGGIL